MTFELIRYKRQWLLRKVGCSGQVIEDRLFPTKKEAVAYTKGLPLKVFRFRG